MLLQDILEIRVLKVPPTHTHTHTHTYKHTHTHTQTHTHKIKSVGKIIKPAKINRWAKQVSSLLILLINVRMLRRLILYIFRPRDYLIGILRKVCFVIPWCVVSVIPATVMCKRQKLVKHIYSLQKTQAGVSSI